MAAKRDSATRVYKYGIVPLEKFPDEAVTELRKANNLWNSLVSLHRQNGDDYEELLCNSDPAYKAAKGRLDIKEEEISKAYDGKRDARKKAGNDKGRTSFNQKSK